MSRGFTDFSDQTVSLSPVGWTQRISNGSGWEVIEPNIQHGKALKFVGPQNARSALTIDEVADSAGVEIYYEFGSETGAALGDPRVAARLDRAKNTSASNAHLYQAGFANGDNVINRYVDGANTSLFSAVESPAPGNTDATVIYACVFRVEGTSFKVKTWDKSGPEPSLWDVEGTDSGITAAGAIGLFTFNGSREMWWSAFGWDTNGGSAPRGPEAPADTTEPTLSSPTATQTGATTADLSVSTDEGNGTLSWVVTSSATPPSVAQVKAGQDHTGAAAADSDSQLVSETGVQETYAIGLTAETTYYAHFQHVDAASNDSTVSTSAPFTTAAVAAVVKGVQVTLYSGSTAQASITGITAMWWDSSPPTGNPVFTTATASTDASGVLEVDLDSDTALEVTDPGHLMVYKLDGTDQIDSLAWQGRLLVQDIS